MDYLGVSALFAVLGWFLKSYFNNSIEHEYKKMFEIFKTEQMRFTILSNERLFVFKELSPCLCMLRKYCKARSAELRDESEFELRTESLNNDENIPLLGHYDNLIRLLDCYELLISSNSRQKFSNFLSTIQQGCSMEVALTSEDPFPESASNAIMYYDSLVSMTNEVLESLYVDLNLPDKSKIT